MADNEKQSTNTDELNVAYQAPLEDILKKHGEPTVTFKDGVATVTKPQAMLDEEKANEYLGELKKSFKEAGLPEDAITLEKETIGGSKLAIPVLGAMTVPTVEAHVIKVSLEKLHAKTTAQAKEEKYTYGTDQKASLATALSETLDAEVKYQPGDGKLAIQFDNKDDATKFITELNKAAGDKAGELGAAVDDKGKLTFNAAPLTSADDKMSATYAAVQKNAETLRAQLPKAMHDKYKTGVEKAAEKAEKPSPGTTPPATTPPPEDDGEEKPKSWFADNSGLLMGAGLALLVAFMAGLGPLGMIIGLLLGAFAGAMMGDKENGMLSGFFGGQENTNTTPGAGTAPGVDPRGHGQGNEKPAPKEFQDREVNQAEFKKILESQPVIKDKDIHAQTLLSMSIKNDAITNNRTIKDLQPENPQDMLGAKYKIFTPEAKDGSLGGVVYAHEGDGNWNSGDKYNDIQVAIKKGDVVHTYKFTGNIKDYQTKDNKLDAAKLIKDARDKKPEFEAISRGATKVDEIHDLLATQFTPPQTPAQPKPEQAPQRE